MRQSREQCSAVALNEGESFEDSCNDTMQEKMNYAKHWNISEKKQNVGVGLQGFDGTGFLIGMY